MFVPSRLLRASKGAETSMFKNSLPKGEVNSAGPRGSPLCGLSLKGGTATPQLQGLNHPAFRSFISKMQILFRSENSLGPWLHLTSGQASPADKLGSHGWHARLTPPVTVTDVLVMCFWKRGFLNYLNQASLSTATPRVCQQGCSAQWEQTPTHPANRHWPLGFTRGPEDLSPGPCPAASPVLAARSLEPGGSVVAALSSGTQAGF